MDQIIPTRSPAPFPQPQPAVPALIGYARPAMSIEMTGPITPPTNPWAIASAVCGIMAIVPVVSQIAGIVLGIVALQRIRRTRREGLPVRGTGWAIAGIVSSGLTLLCWIAIFAAFGAVAIFFSHTTTALDRVIPAHPS